VSETKRIGPEPRPGVESEPYMGTIHVSRVPGRAHLFDSDVEHQHFITVSIHHATRERSLSMNWVHPGDEIVEVCMSEMQWANFVSSFNQGSGVPVTLNHIMGRRIPEPPNLKSEVSKFQKEVIATVAESIGSLKAAIAKLEAGLVPKAKAPNKTELTTILDDLQAAFRQFTNGVPFIEGQFDEYIEAKMVEAKCEFEGFMQGRLRELGLEAAALSTTADEAPKPSFLLGDASKG
jgi:hypothetical protein